MMRRFVRALTLVLPVSLALYGGACSDDTHEEEETPNPELADVVYEGGTNDEALEQLLAGTPTQVPAQSAVFDAPADGAAIPAATAPTFTWHVGPTGALELERPRRRSAPGLELDGSRGAPTAVAHADARQAAPAWAFPSPAASASADRLAGALAELLGPERAARAHGAPLNGAAYLLVLTTPSNAKLLRVFTTATSYTPDATAWGKVEGAGAAVTASVLTGLFDNNALAADGGPFAGTPITFTVAP